MVSVATPVPALLPSYGNNPSCVYDPNIPTYFTANAVSDKFAENPTRGRNKCQHLKKTENLTFHYYCVQIEDNYYLRATDGGAIATDNNMVIIPENCYVGKYWSTSIGKIGCVNCAPGKYQDGRGKNTCKQCVVGKTSNEAASSCNTGNCTAGTFINEDETCQRCSPGKYQENPDQRKCEVCGAGLKSNPTFTNCITIPKFQVQKSGTCTKSVGDSSLCERQHRARYQAGYSFLPQYIDNRPPGCYIDTNNNTVFNNHPDASEPCETQNGCICARICVPGTFANAMSGNCESCPIGKYSNKSDTIACKFCITPGETSSSDRQSCTQCTPGTYNNGYLGICSPCPTNSYQNMSGGTSCKDCPVETITSSTGSSSVSNCIECARPLFFNTTSTQCENCPIGKYMLSTGVSDSCTQCTPGTYNNGYLGICSPCPTNSYQNISGGTSCKDCPVETITSSTGSSSVSNCIECARPLFFNTTSTQCENCPIGKYMLSTGVSECLVLDIPTILFDEKDYQICNGHAYVDWETDTHNIYEVTKSKYIACNNSIGSLIAAEQTGGQKVLALGATPGATRYFICSRHCSEGRKFSTSCVPKTFGVVEAHNATGQCQKQCAKWKGTLVSGFDDDSIDIELLGINCDEMQADIVPLSSVKCGGRRRLRHS